MTETLAIGGALVTVDAAPAPQLPLEPAAPPAPPTPCQEKGHAWQRVSAELNFDGPSTRPRNFRCTRIGCTAVRRDTWMDARWHCEVNPPPQADAPAKKDEEDKPLTDYERGARAADNIRARDASKSAEWLRGYDETEQRRRKPWGVTPPASPTDLAHPGEVDPVVNAIRERTKALGRAQD